MSYQILNQGSLANLSLPQGEVNLTEICNTNEVDPINCGALIDLSVLTVENYINQLPVDPQGGIDPNGTGYFIAEGSVILEAKKAETRIIGMGISESAQEGGVEFACGTLATLEDPDTIVSYNGHDYQTIEIGNQCWFQENLTTTQYSNGDEIPYATDDGGSSWTDASDFGNGVRTCAENDCVANQDTYGFLYNWYVVGDGRGVCPNGWKVPSHNDWSDLERFICMDQGGSEMACNDEFPYLGEGGDPTGHRIVNEEGKHLRDTSFYSGYDTYGFNALPGANYVLAFGMSYNNVGNTAYFWSTDYSHEGHGYDHYWNRSADPYFDGDGIRRGNNASYDGNSIRCLKE